MELLRATAGWLLDPGHWVGPDGIPTRLEQHVVICVVSLLVAAAIALPIGTFIGHTGRGAFAAVNLANIGRAVPSYAVMVMVLPPALSLSPKYGLDVIPIFTAMTLLAIPPILVNTFTGLRQVDPDLVEAGRGMGMRERQLLLRLELPLALPVVLGGVRTAAVQVVATATLGAELGGGGLGRYIVDGIARQEDDRLLAGVFLVAVLALATEAAFTLAARVLTSAGVRRTARVELDAAH